MQDCRFEPVTAANWADLERLFESRGGPKYCWCMVWREMANCQKASSAERKAALRSRLANGTPIGILAYGTDGEPVGWCSVAPRETFRKLSPRQDDDKTGVWSITCFFVPRAHREAGLGAALLQAAVDHAFEEGADVVEAYPVDPDSPSYRFMGFVEAFNRAGFVRTGEAGSRRHVMRLARR